MANEWHEAGDGQTERGQRPELKQPLDLYDSDTHVERQPVHSTEPPAPLPAPWTAVPVGSGAAGPEQQTIAALQRRIAELEPLSERLADTEQRRMSLEVQMRLLQEERDKLAAERVERAALKRRNERLETELNRARQMSETALRELSETRMHAEDTQEASKDWSREALRLRKQLENSEHATIEARRRLKAAGDALHSAVDGIRPVRRGDLVRLAKLMTVDAGDADAMVEEVRRLFPR
ncbi:hypothetical protein [Engelhardtia mirabilis]|uniref:Chromosome partition protein Smc n=1 Tax=Engelhardtia mirabilis TaxID=2528011 RepID=A0A518BEL9_9BACT|nr:hypothetical protein Pla133_04710 [Planctomycetes bacterium Pla133]QDU99732.1 hypothetical protein Pla86_04710 [Planctomycetes bacterium Pla86]